MEKAGMIIGTYQVQGREVWALKKGKFYAWWFGGPRNDESLTREEFQEELRARGALMCQVCGEKILGGWVHVNIAYSAGNPEGLVFAEHAECVGKPRVSR